MLNNKELTAVVLASNETFSLEKVQSKLSVDLSQGLSSLEVSRRRDIHGFNEVNVGKPDPLWKKYIDQFNNPFILLLLLSAFISICMKQYDDAVCVTIAIVIVVTVGFIQEYRSEQTLENSTQLQLRQRNLMTLSTRSNWPSRTKPNQLS